VTVYLRQREGLRFKYFYLTKIANFSNKLHTQTNMNNRIDILDEMPSQVKSIMLTDAGYDEPLSKRLQKRRLCMFLFYDVYILFVLPTWRNKR